MDRIAYQLTEEDLLKFNLYHSANSDLHRKQRRWLRLFLPAAFALYAVFLCFWNKLGDALVFVAVAAAWYILSPIWLRRRYRKIYAKHIKETVGDTLREPMTLELRPDAICTSSFVGESKYRYSAVGTIAESDGVTYVFIGKGMALILPHDRIPKATIDALVTAISQRKQEETQTAAAGSSAPLG